MEVLQPALQGTPRRARIKYPPTNKPKVCKRCSVEKPAERFFVAPCWKDGRQATCKDCLNPLIVAKNTSPERRAVLRQHVYAHRATDWGKEQRRKQHKNESRRKAEAAGRPYRPKEEAPFRNAEAKAVAAWNNWLRSRAPNNWLDTFYSSQPWKDHRLSHPERHKLRYRLDPDYHLQVRVRDAAKAKARKRGIDPWKVRKHLRDGTRMLALWHRCGYTIPQLRAHLEAQFTNGMTWDVFCAGKIDIDHIIPLRCFDLSNPDEVKRAWALDNLQPLWPIDNYRKGGKISMLQRDGTLGMAYRG